MNINCTQCGSPMIRIATRFRGGKYTTRYRYREFSCTNTHCMTRITERKVRDNVCKECGM